MTLITTILAFLVALGPLIIIHELGHYWVARLCGVKVLRFSIGMGKVVWSRRFGPDQTEWAVSALPLGGYVKFLDSRDPETAPKDDSELAREFTRQNVWRRIAIVAAGPLANFLLAIVLMAGLFMHGVDEPSTRVRAMPETTAAYSAGLRAGDSIAAVNGAPVARRRHCSTPPMKWRWKPSSSAALVSATSTASSAMHSTPSNTARRHRAAACRRWR